MGLTKTVGKMILMLIIGILIGTGLLWLVFLLPEKNIYRHGAISLQTLADEGLYPSVGNSPADKLDNWTDSIMLGTAFYVEKDVTPLDRAMSVYQPVITTESADPLTAAFAYVNGMDYVGGLSYSRYWHGYLTILRPLLLLTDYDGIRVCNNIGVILTLLFIFGALIWKKYYSLIIPIALTFLFLRPLAIMFSLQYSSVYYVSSLNILWIILCHSKLEEHFRYLFLFLLNGMLTGYLDLLTYPIVSLGFPLAIFLATQKGLSWIGQCKRVLYASVAWGLGYLGIWAGKWLISSLILKKNVFTEAIGSARFRISANSGNRDFSRLEVCRKNMEVCFSNIQFIAIFILAVSILYFIRKNRKCLLNAVLNTLPHLLVACIPFIWYIVFANHSYIHFFFTYRDLAITVCSLTYLCFAIRTPLK